MESATANRGGQQSLPLPTVASLGSLEGGGTYLWKDREGMRGGEGRGWRGERRRGCK